MAHTVDLQKMSVHKRARFATFCELLEQEETVAAIAARLEVDERTVLRYLRELEGRPRNVNRYDQYMPRVMAHLRRYPRSEFTSTELARVLDIRYGNNGRYGGKYDGSALASTLRRMEREGLVQAVHGLRDERNYTVHLPVTRWRLAQVGDA
ncbi:hypothetical protein ABZ912_05470 [Nonomuraea angiospora]|uniref:hypothetical protein n=1 Tax=Nonomuraea angiospora TaxID=46172 RepID=UPI0033DC45BF